MNIAYADPPYPGCAKRHYGSQEVNHAVLIQGLEDNFDGWALSTGVENLRAVLPLCPEKIRICAWVKPFNAMKSNVAPIYAWEPLIVKGARIGRKSPYFVKDYISAMPPIFQHRTTSECHGEKPKEYYIWMFKMIGAAPGDDFTDLFPGSGNGMKYWAYFTSQKTIEVDDNESP
jgi:hypothetical protein